MKIGILAIGMVVLFIASTIPAVSAAPPQKVSFSATELNVIFHNFDNGDAYVINVYSGAGGTNLVGTLTGTIVNLETPPDKMFVSLDELKLKTGLYTIVVSVNGDEYLTDSFGIPR